MKTKTTKKTSGARRPANSAVSAVAAPVTKKTSKAKNAQPLPEKCRHCGGMIKFEPGDNACVMCGRPADHFCQNCLFAEKHVA